MCRYGLGPFFLFALAHNSFSEDIVERFQLALMLGSIAIRNLIELSSSELDLSADNAFVLPVAFKAFKFISGRHIIGPILTVSLVRMLFARVC